MAFDEDTHMAIIQFFSRHPNPFFSVQPTYLDKFGSVAHGTSYLYQFLLAGPWRLIESLPGSFTLHLIFLRIINIGLFATALVIFRKVLIMATKSQSITNLTLLLIVLTPLTSQLAGQVNYDNLIVLLFAWCLLLVCNFSDSLERTKFDAVSLALFTSLGLLACLVNYKFLPLLAGMILYILWRATVYYKSDRNKFVSVFNKGIKTLSSWQRTGLSVLVILSLGLFCQRYLVNTIQFHSPLAKCEKVIGADRCRADSIYQRSIEYQNTKPAAFNRNPLYFTGLWLKHMNYNLMMVLNGPDSGYATGKVLPLPYIAVIIFSSGGIVLCVIYWRKLFKSNKRKLLLIIILVYLISLWILNYSEYLSTGRRVAVQGRYLVPVLPLTYGLFVLAWSKLVRSWHSVSIVVTAGFLACLLLGGGFLTFVVHSDESWYFDNRFSKGINSTAQRILRPVIPGSIHTPYWQSSFEF